MFWSFAEKTFKAKHDVGKTLKIVRLLGLRFGGGGEGKNTLGKTN